MIMIEQQLHYFRSLAVDKSAGFSMRDEMCNALNEAADTIEALSAKNGGWIPVSERMPEVEKTVLLSLRGLDITVGFKANTEGYFWTESEGYVLIKNTLAWRELPEPYTVNA